MVADAFLGVHGLNRRKGICKSQDDLLDELADVIITAARPHELHHRGRAAGAQALRAAAGSRYRAGQLVIQ
jgi:hypothetical protein